MNDDLKMPSPRIAGDLIEERNKLRAQVQAGNPTATGEWTVFGTSVQINGEALFHCSTRKDAEIASLEHNAAMESAKQDFAKEIAAEREISGTLAEQLHELRVAFGQAEDWNKITSIEINNIRSFNREITEDKLKTELACEQWIRQCEELQQKLNQLESGRTAQSAQNKL